MTFLAVTFGNIDHASSRTRVYNYLPFLKDDGISVFVLPSRPVQKKTLFFPFFRFGYKVFSKLIRLVLLSFFSWDAVWVHRVFLSQIELRIINVRKIKLIFDFDDAIFLGSSQNRRKTLNMVSSSFQTCVSTPFLADFCRTAGKDPVVITTPVDITLFYPDPNKKTGENLVIGWTGSPSTSKYLVSILPALEAVGKKYPKVEFIFTGTDQNLTIGQNKTVCVPWTLKGEPGQIRKMDIGLMPLPDDEWSRNKGGYKIFLYFASGLPAVVSPVGINTQIVTEGETGFFAKTLTDWVETLCFLVENESLRIKMGQTALTNAHRFYSLQACYHQLSLIFNPSK